MSAPESHDALAAVRGERGSTLVHAARSVQSRLSGLLAAGLMMAMGASALTWYYAHTLTRQREVRAAARSSTAGRAQAEMTLPPLGRITPPAPPAPPMPPASTATLPELPLPETSASSLAGSLGSAPAASSAVTEKTPAQMARERRLSGAVFAREGTPPASSAAASGPVIAASTPPAAGSPAQDVPAPRDTAGALAALLRPVVTGAVQAQILPSSRLLLPRGAFIDCTLETAIDSTLPGMTTCVTAADTFSADGKVVLLERGTKLVGETRGQVQPGQARVFVLWSLARTPTGVVVPLDSPGTDQLGRAGLPGEVERHFWERFGAAMLISVIDGAVQAGVQAANRSGGAVIYAPSGSQDVLTEVLKGSVGIAPTVVKKNGDRIQVLVARDLDFRSVYELRVSGAR
jgi:type IV secretion system protein VirB10